MAYHFTTKEPVPDGIRRIVGEEIESATALLARPSQTNRDEAVHEARKSVKKVRGVLRLVRPALGQTYKRENKHFRSVGHRLSALRDAAALLEIFDHLAAKFASVFDEKDFAEIRRGLEREKAHTEDELNLPKAVERATGELESAKSRLNRWPLRNNGFTEIEPGLKQTYRRGRKALKLARKKQNAVSYHDFRKRVKDHWYHIRLLEELWTKATEAHEANLKKLETWLGDDHNLTVLREKIEAHPDTFGGAKQAEPFLALVAGYQQELRENATCLGERVYQEKPRAFTRSVQTLWKAWQKEPQTTAEPPEQPAKKQPARVTKKAKRTAA